MNEQEREAVRTAMSILGSQKTPAQTEARRGNMAKAVAARTGKPISEEHKAALRQSQTERRERERAEREAIVLSTESSPSDASRTRSSAS
jgi:type IV secretory pathway ATPase VirB11/archaellum biosynthesis ATPase